MICYAKLGHSPLYNWSYRRTSKPFCRTMRTCGGDGLHGKTSWHLSGIYYDGLAHAQWTGSRLLSKMTESSAYRNPFTCFAGVIGYSRTERKEEGSSYHSARYQLVKRVTLHRILEFFFGIALVKCSMLCETSYSASLIKTHSLSAILNADLKPPTQRRTPVRVRDRLNAVYHMLCESWVLWKIRKKQLFSRNPWTSTQQCRQLACIELTRKFIAKAFVCGRPP